MALNPEFIKFVDILCQLQAKTGQFITLPSENEITDNDIRSINILFTIINQGKLVRKIEVVENLFQTDLPIDILERHQKNEPVSLSISHNESSIELFKQKIEMGRVDETLVGVLDMTTTELESAIKNSKSGDGVMLRLINVQSVANFAKWSNK